ncbi:MAG TPA: PAS domain S-box protein, partial [Opitutaceae bacterium]
MLLGPKSDRAELRQMRDALGRGESYAGETIAYRKDGTEFQMERQVVPLRNSIGTITHFLGIQRDITARKQAEIALRESNEKFHQLAENITDVFWIRSPDMREVQYVSPGFERIWGRSTESLYANPKGWTDAIVPQDREPVRAAFATLMEAAPSISIEYRIAQPAGEIRWIHARGFQVRDAGGKLIRLTGIITDITARKQAEQTLCESKRFAESIAENSTSLIYLIDLATGRNIYANRDIASQLGYSSAQMDELGDNPLLRLIHPDDRARVGRHFAQFADVRDSRVIDVEYRVKDAGGDWRWLWARDTVFKRRPDGSACEVMGTVQNITQRKRAEADLETVHKQLVETSRQAGMAEIATNVLHNVGNILNSVNVSAALVSNALRTSRARGLTEALQLMEEHSADLSDFLTLDEKGKLLPGYLGRSAQALAREQQRMIEELAHLTQSIDHIKAVVATQQSHAGGASLVEPAQICELAEDALRMNGGELVRHGVTVVKQFAQVPVAMLDRARVLQILVNLISNASQALQNVPDESHRITLTVDTFAGSGLRVSVKDEGEGIPAQNLTRIFAHGFTTRKTGHGFGLHSSALAARQMGGTLTAHSEGPGKGATFT